MKDGTHAKKVFCSHRSIDKPAVEDFARRLRERGIDAWLDKWEIRAGHDFVQKINQGLRGFDVGLIFFSHQTATGAWVTAEVSALIPTMIEQGRPIIPVMAESGLEDPRLTMWLNEGMMWPHGRTRNDRRCEGAEEPAQRVPPPSPRR